MANDPTPTDFHVMLKEPCVPTPWPESALKIFIFFVDRLLWGKWSAPNRRVYLAASCERI